MKPSPLRSYIALALVTGGMKYCSMWSKSSVVMTLFVFDAAQIASRFCCRVNL